MPTIRPELEKLAVPIDKVHPHPRNPHKGNVAEVAGSLTEHGQYRPIVAHRETGDVLAGNTTWLAAKTLGWRRIAVTYFDGDETEGLRVLAGDNRYAELGVTNGPALLDVLRDLAATEEGLVGTGYDTGDLTALIDGVERKRVVAHTDPDAIPPDAPARTKVGDVWLLGEHRLICGDAREPDDYEALHPDGEGADLIVTDPPYNVDYEGKTADKLTIEGDRQTEDEFRTFLTEGFTAMAEQLREGGPAYVFHADLGAVVTREAFAAAGLEVHQGLVWVKQSFVMGRQDYQWQHECILYGWKPGAAHAWYGGRTRNTLLDDDVDPATLKKGELLELVEQIRGAASVIREDRPTRSLIHPTMKPVRLLERLISNSSRAGEIVLDPYAGAGSTIIAAHHTGRIARAIEKDREYCDRICRRWQEHVGELPIREATGRATDFVKGSQRGKARAGSQANGAEAGQGRAKRPRQSKRAAAAR